MTPRLNEDLSLMEGTICEAVGCISKATINVVLPVGQKGRIPVYIGVFIGSHNAHLRAKRRPLCRICRTEEREHYAAGNTVRRHLFHQHHSRRRYRYRGVDRSRVPACDARRRRPHRSESVPGFPYDHFARVTDDDVSAIYAFIMTRDPVRATVPANRLAFPMNFRPMLSAWKALYLERGVYRSDPGRSAEWNRGAYLVEGLGHCGACHTPRNAMGAERKDRYLGGGEAEGWHATALNASSPAPVAWTVDQLTRYLRQGWDDEHGHAAGPMSPVVHELADVPEADVRAMATYLLAVMGKKEAAAMQTAAPSWTNRVCRPALRFSSGPAPAVTTKARARYRRSGRFRWRRRRRFTHLIRATYCTSCSKASGPSRVKRAS